MEIKRKRWIDCQQLLYWLNKKKLWCLITAVLTINLITRTIREFGVYSELHAHTTTADEIKNMNAVGIILSGGPVSVKDAYGIDAEIFNAGIPILGISYGTHLITENFGGETEKIICKWVQ